jgi:DNA-binding NarL/FixJ family response regulator
VRFACSPFAQFMSFKKTKPPQDSIRHFLPSHRLRQYLEELAVLKNKISKIESDIFSLRPILFTGNEFLTGVDERAASVEEIEEYGYHVSRQLSMREEEVLKLVSKGYTDKEIADKIFVSVNTVKTHLRRIYEKLQVKNRAEAAMKLKG